MVDSSNDLIYLDEDGNVQIEDLTTGIYTFSLEQSNDLVPAQVTDFEFIVCGVEVNSEEISMTAGQPETRSLLANDATAQMVCEGETIELGEANGQDFMYLDDEFNLVIDPSADLVSNVGTYDVEIIHTREGEEPVSSWMTVTVMPDCSAQTW
jgi:hypothetical protein